MNEYVNISFADADPHPELAARKVGANCHVAYKGVYYSVPHDLYKQMVMLRATNSTIDILNSDGECVASHCRCFARRGYVTNPAHMPQYYHSVFEDDNRYDGARLRKWAKDIGDNTLSVIDEILCKPDIEEHAYKSCMAVLQLSRKYGKHLLEFSCCTALNINRCNFFAIKKILLAEYEKRRLH